jgi:hypothetical protein
VLVVLAGQASRTFDLVQRALERGASSERAESVR